MRKRGSFLVLEEYEIIPRFHPETAGLPKLLVVLKF